MPASCRVLVWSPSQTITGSSKDETIVWYKKTEIHPRDKRYGASYSVHMNGWWICVGWEKLNWRRDLQCYLTLFFNNINIIENNLKT